MTALAAPAALPREISRPLWITAIGLFCFLLLIMIWAIYAPIATTVRVSGSFASSRLSYDIQHPFGGRIEQVFVSLHQVVAKNDPLFLLDVNSSRSALAEIETQLDTLNTETSIIQYFLDKPSTPSPKNSFITLQYYEAQRALKSKIDTKEQAIIAANARLQTASQGLAMLKQRQAILHERSLDSHDLVARGIVTRKADEALTDTILNLGSQIAEEESREISLRAEIAQSKIAIDTLRAEYRLALVKKLNANTARLPELRQQALRLQSEISSALVRSPVAGKITSLKYDTAQMYAGKGQTLVTLAQKLDHPVPHLKVPITLIDQIHPGMTGTLTIPALPQRKMPKIRVTLTSIAPEATKTPDGQAEYYLALATINQDDLQAAARRMGAAFHLATDMPVMVSLEGRETTMYRYLFGAFANLFTDALQD